VAIRAKPCKSIDDFRERDWVVAVHNDYRKDGTPHTFWLLTNKMKGILSEEITVAIKGEGRTDAEAFEQLALAELHVICAITGGG
jgi:hypothetical protein